MVVLEILGQDAMQMGLVEHNHMIQTIAAYRTDNSFAVRILPRRAWCNQDVLDAHVLDASLEVIAIDERLTDVSLRTLASFIPRGRSLGKENGITLTVLHPAKQHGPSVAHRPTH